MSNFKKFFILTVPVTALLLFVVFQTFNNPASAWDLLPGEKPPTGEQIVLDLHCHTCHVMPGAEKHSLTAVGGLRILPSLDFEDDRARPEWVFGFLKEPFHLRPELHAQMPNFALNDEEAIALTKFLMTLKLDKEVYVPEDMPPVKDVKDPDTIKQAKSIFDLYKCFQCHLLEGKLIDPEKGQSGPDFVYTYDRLNIDWNYQWLVDPQVYIPGTKMPNFFYSDDEELIDDPDADMHMILVYMYSLGDPKDYADYKKIETEYASATAEQGKKLAEDLYCTGCHEFSGWDKLEVTDLVKKHENYDLTKVAARRDKKWLTTHFKDPIPKRPKEGVVTRRPGFQLNSQELKALVDYLSKMK